MKKIIIYGGAFDPIHKGHIESAKLSVNKIKADLIYLVPTYSSELKNLKSSSFKQRMDMIKIAIKQYPKFKLSKWDINNKNLYTINLINHFINKNTKVFLLIGADQVNNFHNWKNAVEISKKVQIIYVGRPKVKINFANVKKYNMQFIANVKYDISSTMLRKISNKKYLDKNIINYINDNCLYTKERIQDFLSNSRWEHCQRTAIYAKKLAIKNKYKFPHEAYIAGLFHDLAKEFSKNELLYYANLLKIKEFTSIEILHSYVAYYFMKYFYLFNNQNILNSVYNHTKPNFPNKLTKLDKIIYVADKCEPGRQEKKYNLVFDIKTIRNLAIKDIDKAFNILYKQINTFFENKK